MQSISSFIGQGRILCAVFIAQTRLLPTLTRPQSQPAQCACARAGRTRRFRRTNQWRVAHRPKCKSCRTLKPARRTRQHSSRDRKATHRRQRLGRGHGTLGELHAQWTQYHLRQRWAPGEHAHPRQSVARTNPDDEKNGRQRCNQTHAYNMKTLFRWASQETTNMPSRRRPPAVA